MAIGVLIGWRGCPEREAFNEPARAVHDTGVGIGSIGRALVQLATGAVESGPHREEALRLWADAMPMRSASVSASLTAALTPPTPAGTPQSRRRNRMRRR
jgi:hypothetical protein